MEYLVSIKLMTRTLTKETEMVECKLLWVKKF